MGWWASENTKGRHLWPGLYTGRVTGPNAKAKTKPWPAKEIADQIALVREQPGTDGEVHFSMKSLMRNSGGVADAVKAAYAEPALVPESPWLPADKPATGMSVADGVATVTGEGVRFVVVRALKDGKWTTTVSGPRAAWPTADKVVLTYVDRTGREIKPVEKAK